jgi:hypothetical protein
VTEVASAVLRRQSTRQAAYIGEIGVEVKPEQAAGSSA